MGKGGRVSVWVLDLVSSSSTDIDVPESCLDLAMILPGIIICRLEKRMT